MFSYRNRLGVKSRARRSGLVHSRLAAASRIVANGKLLVRPSDSYGLLFCLTNRAIVDSPFGIRRSVRLSWHALHTTIKSGRWKGNNWTMVSAIRWY
jgi:hypothetical protein